MKTKIHLLPILKAAFLFVIISTALSAGAQSYEATLRNDTLTSDNHLLVDIYIKATSGPFFYGSGQYKVLFNPALNNGTVHVAVVPGFSDFTNTDQQPDIVTQPTVSNSRFVVVAHPNPLAQNFCSIISDVGFGTRVCRVDITRTGAFPQVPANLQITSAFPVGTAIFYMDPDGWLFFCQSTMVNTNLVNPMLNQPINTTYTLTGGSYCYSGTDVVLSGSETGVSYKLIKDGTDHFPVMAGTGNPITWTGQTAGTYTVFAWRTAESVSCSFGPASVIHNPPSIGGSINPLSDIIGFGSGTGVMTLSGHTGTVLKWQKQFNGGGYTDIPITTTTYSEVPGPVGTYNYRCEVQNAPCPPVFSDSNTIIVTRTPVTTAGTGNTCAGGLVTIPVTVKLFNAMTAMMLRMDYDPTLMTWSGYENTNPILTGMTVSDQPSSSPPLRKILVFWSDIAYKTLPDDAKIVDLKFTTLGGAPVLTFNNTANGGQDCEYADMNSDPLPDSPTSTYYHDAAIYIGPAAAGPITGPASVCLGASGVAYSVNVIANATGYAWQLPAGATITSGVNTNSITVDFAASAVSGNITVAGTNVCPEQGTSSSLFITVNPVPAPTITGPDTVCKSVQPGNAYTTEPGMTGYTWTCSAGGTITSGAGTNTVTASWNTAGPAWIKVNYQNSQGCSATTPAQLNVFVRTVPPNPGPVSGPNHVTQGDTNVSYHIAPVPGATGYVWNAYTGVTIVSGQGTDSITVNFGLHAPSFYIWVYPVNQCGTSVMYSALAIWVARHIGGKYAYHNQAGTPIDTLKLVLYQDNKSSVAIDSTYTDASGNFLFSHLGPGTYTIRAFTQDSWNGVTATDALLVERHFAGFELLTEPVSLDAADVNMSGGINGTDALKIKRRFVGLDPGFDKGNWVFDIQGLGGNQVAIVDTDVVANFYGLCVGDVNGSYTPAGNKERGSNVDLVSEGSISVQPGQYFELPVWVRTNMTVNAVSLVIPFPGDLLELTGIEMSQGTPVWNFAAGQLHIAWSDLQSLDLKAGDVLMILKLKVKEAIPGNPVIELHPAWESELADNHGKVIPFAELSCPTVKILTAPGINEGISQQNVLQVFPNPAKDIVNVEFSLESQAECSFQLIDVTGRIVKMIPEKRFETGYGKIQISSSDLADGLYNLKVKINSKTGTDEYLRKVIINR